MFCQCDERRAVGLISQSWRSQALPEKVAPMFLTGNLGEVLLLLSLVISETIIRG